VELTARRMAQFRAEHIGHEIEIGDGFGNDFGSVTGHIHTIVVYSINVETVQTRTGATDRTTFSQHSGSLGSRVRRQQSQIQRSAPQSWTGQVGHGASAEIVRELSRSRLNK